MQKFNKLSAIAAPIMRQNIDTDMVIRVERLRDLPPDKLGPYAFESWRYKPDGSEAPEFVLNRPPYREAKIILAADNFGCGSSREAAVWSLFGFGIRCVIAPSFGPIFYNNCFQNGLLPVAVPLEVIEEMVAEVEAIGRRRGLFVACYGHAGDGNLHANVLFDREEERPNVDAAVVEILEAAVRLDGTITGEHGVGLAKKEFLGLEQSPGLIALQKRLKAVFDPLGILNPGKMFPGA